MVYLYRNSLFVLPETATLVSANNFILMNKLLYTLFLGVLTTFSLTAQAPRVLVFSKTASFRHASIEDGKVALMKMGAENGFKVDTTEDASAFNE